MLTPEEKERVEKAKKQLDDQIEQAQLDFVYDCGFKDGWRKACEKILADFPLTQPSYNTLKKMSENPPPTPKISSKFMEELEG